MLHFAQLANKMTSHETHMFERKIKL